MKSNIKNATKTPGHQMPQRLNIHSGYLVKLSVLVSLWQELDFSEWAQPLCKPLINDIPII